MLTSESRNYGMYCMHPPDEAVVICQVPSRRLDDRIRELCAQVVETDGEIEPLISELRAALREHNNRLRKLAAAKLANPLPPPVRLTL